MFSIARKAFSTSSVDGSARPHLSINIQQSKSEIITESDVNQEWKRHSMLAAVDSSPTTAEEHIYDHLYNFDISSPPFASNQEHKSSYTQTSQLDLPTKDLGVVEEMSHSTYISSHSLPHTSARSSRFTDHRQLKRNHPLPQIECKIRSPFYPSPVPRRSPKAGSEITLKKV